MPEEREQPNDIEALIEAFGDACFDCGEWNGEDDEELDGMWDEVVAVRGKLMTAISNAIVTARSQSTAAVDAGRVVGEQ